HNHLCETVEQRAPGFLVALLTIRIAVANANQGAFAGNLEPEAIIRRWNRAPFFVECLNFQNCDILSVSVDLGSVGSQPDRHRRTGCLPLVSEHNLAILAASRFNCSRSVFHLPLNMSKMRNLLAACTLAVDQELNLVHVRVHPYRNLFAFPAREVPVRKHMNYRILAPPGLVVEEVVFRESAHIHNSKLRIDRRPPIRSWLAAIVEAGPCEATGLPLAGAVERPPFFSSLAPWHYAV